LTGRFTFISHAATQAQRRAAFPLDEPLEEQEISKIAALRWKAPRAQHVFAAPERRAQQTAKTLGLSAVTVEELRDCNYGEWCGREFDELYSSDPEGVGAWLTDPDAVPHGGESVANLIGRVAGWLNEHHHDGHTIVVTHPGVIRSAIVHVLAAAPKTFWRIDIATLSLTDIRFNGNVWTLRSIACPLRERDESSVG
jgi:broad specificity phosphatase PhoE